METTQSETNDRKISMEEIEVYVQPTPNPNALKFITSTAVKTQGKSTYNSPDECEEVPLALAIFEVPGVSQIYLFQNAITVTKFSFEDWENIEDQISEVIKENLPKHDPDYQDRDLEAERRASLPKEIQEIEEILDRTVRPYLQGDGGDLQCVNYQDNVLTVQYMGACGNCPSSEAGTLQAIASVLRNEFNPEIEVYSIPSSPEM